MIEVKGVGILHQEFARAHDAETGSDLVAHLVLDLVQVERQLPVAADLAAHDVRDDLFVGRTEAEIAFVPVLDAQQFGTVLLPAPGLLPQLAGLHHGHCQLLGTGGVHFLAHDGLDLAQHSQSHGHPGVEARGQLAHQAGPQHQAVADDFRIGGRFTVRGDQELAAAHGSISWRGERRARV
jgi:hypothetical protein